VGYLKRAVNLKNEKGGGRTCEREFFGGGGERGHFSHFPVIFAVDFTSRIISYCSGSLRFLVPRSSEWTMLVAWSVLKSFRLII